jgi:hypothetical protein
MIIGITLFNGCNAKSSAKAAVQLSEEDYLIYSDEERELTIKIINEIVLDKFSITADPLIIIYKDGCVKTARGVWHSASVGYCDYSFYIKDRDKKTVEFEEAGLLKLRYISGGTIYYRTLG